MIRPAASDDAAAIAEIYNHYIANSTITFEEQAVAADELAERIRETEADQLPYLVAEHEGQIVGYAYASRWRGRCAYRFSVEVTVYLSPNAVRCGHGTALYKALFAELRQRSYRVAIAGIALPNPASIALHEKLGMEKVAHFKEVGFKFGQWLDVGYWQCTIAP